MQTNQIASLPRDERYAKFIEILKSRNISIEESPVDYSDDLKVLFKEINDQDYRDANNGENPPSCNIRDTELFKKTQGCSRISTK